MITLETSLCPYLFPFGSGFHNESMKFLDYLKMRTGALFSPFSLNKVYLLTMYQLRQAVLLSNQFRQMQLEKSIAAYIKKNPDADKQQVFQNVLKHDIPSTVPNSPQWHKNHLNDLLSMVDA